MVYVTPQEYWLIDVERVNQSTGDDMVAAIAILVGNQKQERLYLSAEWKILKGELDKMGIEFHGLPDWIIPLMTWTSNSKKASHHRPASR